jgi:hypothetical protein
VECTGKTGVFGFGFSGQATRPALPGRRRLPEEKCNSQAQKIVIRCRLSTAKVSLMDNPVLQFRAAASKPGVPTASRSALSPKCSTVSHQPIQKNSFVELGAPVWSLPFFLPE